MRRTQLPVALERRPDLASLIVGLNDILRPSWDAGDVRADLLSSARMLAAHGATLLSVRFHDHGRVLRLRGPVARTITRRVNAHNDIFDEVHLRYGGLRIDLGEGAEIYERKYWSVDRLHPSELGHRTLARRFAVLLLQQGLMFPLPSLVCDGPAARPLDDLRRVVAEVAPWLGRRAGETGLVIARSVLRRTWVRIGTEGAL
jgi:hypothetical protein